MMGLIKKLLIKPGYQAAIVNAPADFALPSDELPENVKVTEASNENVDFLLLFAKNQDELKQYVPQALPRLNKAAVFWVAYPKKSSKLKSDITRDSGWEILQESGYEGVSLISIDDTWSAFRLRHEADRKPSK